MFQARVSDACMGPARRTRREINGDASHRTGIFSPSDALLWQSGSFLFKRACFVLSFYNSIIFYSGSGFGSFGFALSLGFSASSDGRAFVARITLLCCACTACARTARTRAPHFVPRTHARTRALSLSFSRWWLVGCSFDGAMIFSFFLFCAAHHARARAHARARRAHLSRALFARAFS